jgi:hypothetical protein
MDCCEPASVLTTGESPGVISGAGAAQPGFLLGEETKSTVPIALAGTVYCKMTAEVTPVSVGDLVVSSPTPGHAMAASDPLRAFGAVVGKALGTLEEGRDLVPILVSLQ